MTNGPPAKAALRRVRFYPGPDPSSREHERLSFRRRNCHSPTLPTLLAIIALPSANFRPRRIFGEATLTFWETFFRKFVAALECLIMYVLSYYDFETFMGDSGFMVHQESIYYQTAVKIWVKYPSIVD